MLDISRSLQQINMNVIANAESDKSQNPGLLSELCALSKLEVKNEEK